MKILRFLKRQSKALHVFMLMLLAAPMYVSAQETLTVFDGTTANQYIPMYGYYFDDYTKSECIIPATELTDMDGGTITAITFYAKTVSTTNSTWSNTNQKVFIKEVSNTTLGGSYIGMTGATIIFDGQLPMPTTSTEGYTITFSDSYTYEGGNLLIGVYNDDDGSFNKVEWFGTGNLTSGVSAYGSDGSSLGGVPYNAQSFLPKTTFTYEPGNVTCPKPKDLEASNITETSATLTWTNGEEGQTAWQIAYKAGSNFNPNTDPCTIVDVSSNPSTINNLESLTTYYAYVRANCGESGYSSWSASPCHFTPGCFAISDFPWTEDFESRPGGYFNVPCWENGHVSGSGDYLFYVQSGNNSTSPNTTKLLMLMRMSSGTQTKLVLPQMQFDAGEDYLFSIDVFRNATSSNYSSEGIRVFASTDGTLEHATELGFIPRYYGINGGSYVTYESTTGWYTYRFPIPTNTTNIILRGDSQNGGDIYLDNLKVSVAPSCSFPTNLRVPSDDVMARSATLTWNAGNATEWIVEYRKTQTQTEYTAVEGTITEPTYVLTGLEPQTQYAVRVRAVCSPTEITDPCNPKTFTTVAPYAVPQKLKTIHVSEAGATLKWVARDNEDHWDLFYTENPDYVPQSNTHPQFTNITANPFQLTGLESGRVYYAYVRSNEGSNGVSGWSAPCRFFLANELTVNDGIVTNSTVPVLGHCVNNSFSGYFIIPAEDLQDLVHADIRQMVFYNSASNTANIDWGDVRYNLALGETAVIETNSSSISYYNGTTCFTGSIRIIDHQMTIEFDKPYHYNGDNLRVGFSSNPSGTVNTAYAYWLGVATENTPGYGSSYYYHSYNDYGVYSFLPKVTFSYLFPDCPAPNDLQADNITTNSATLSWVADSGQDWEIQYVKAEEADDEANYIGVQGTVTNPYTLEGLEPSHGYRVRVRTVCGEGLYSEWTETWFATQCEPLTSLPYSTGFEDMVYGVVPPCWSYYSSFGEAPLVGSYGSHTGHFCMELYGYELDDIQFIILPQIPVDVQHPMSGNELVFYGTLYYGSSSVHVGIMTDPTNPETFVSVEELEMPTDFVYRKYKVSFANYSGNGTYIAIRMQDTNEYDSYLFIDDVVVRPIPDCAEPVELSVSALTSSTASLQWTSGGTETTWQVQYKLANDEWPETYQTVSQNTCTLSTLAEASEYNARVRSVCSGTETSEWSEVVSFVTGYLAPFADDFDTYDENQGYISKPGWQSTRALLDDVLNHTTNLFSDIISSSWGTFYYTFSNWNDGMNYFTDGVFCCNANGANDHEWLISPMIELGEGYQLNFDLALLYESSTSGLDDNRFAVLITTDNCATWTVLGIWDNDGSGLEYYDIPNYPVEVNFDLSDYDNQNVRIAFYVESTVAGSGYSQYTSNVVYLDNVNVTKLVKPELIVASEETENSAILTWTGHGETSWTLQYRPDNAYAEWTTVNDITSLPYTLQGLQMSRYYQVRVKAHYALGDSEWSTIAVFSTSCEPISLAMGETFEETFDGIMVPTCWENRAGNGNARWSKFYDYGYSSHSSTGFYSAPADNNSSANLIMPQIEVTPGMSLTFHHSTQFSSNIQIKVRVSNNSNFWNYPSYGYICDDLWDSNVDDFSSGVTTLSLNAYAGQTVYVSFYSYKNSSNTGGWSYVFSLYDVTLSRGNAFVKQTENGYWDETENWTAGVLPEATESVTIVGPAVIPNGCIAQADEIFIATTGSLTIADGGQLEHNNAGVVATVQKSIMPYTIAQTEGELKSNGWYLVASPMQNAVEPSGGFISNNFDLYRFNQSVDLEWENYLQLFYLSPYFKLFNGKGYLYANGGDGTNDAVTVEINGQLQPSNEELTFPLIYDASAGFAGWNLVGNPFAHDVTAYTATNVEDGCFRMNETQDDLMVSEVTATDPLQPMEGFFVKATGENASITFNPSGAKGKAKVIEPTVTESGQSVEMPTITLNLSENGKLVDRLIMKENGQGLEKLSLNENHAKLFAAEGQREMAIVPIKDNEQTISFKAAHDGNYTLTVNINGMEMDYLHLIDNLTGKDIDFLATPSYTFEGKTTDIVSRFKLVLGSSKSK